jgi:hypothetical protein
MYLIIGHSRLSSLLEAYQRNSPLQNNKTDQNPSLAAFLEIIKIIIIPFFNSLNIASKNDNTKNANIIVSSLLWDCLRPCLNAKMDFAFDEKLQKKSNQSIFLKELFFQIKFSYHELNKNSKALFSARYASFYNSCFFVMRDVSLEWMEDLNDLLFVVTSSQIDNEDFVTILENWLPNAVFSNYRNQMSCLYTEINKEALTLLVNTSESFYKYDQMLQWKNSFSEFIAKNNLNLEDAISEHADECYRHHSLINIVFKIECFYFRHGKYSYIKQLWYARDFLGSNIQYVGGEIHPESIDDIILMYCFYIQPDVINQVSYFDMPFEHVSYTKQFFILSLLKILKEHSDDRFSKISSLGNSILRDLERLSFDVGGLKDSIDQLRKNEAALALLKREDTQRVSTSVLEISDQNNIIQKSNMNEDPESLFARLDDFLKKLSEQCKQELEKRSDQAPLSLHKIQRLKDEFWQGYNQKGLLASHLNKKVVLEELASKDSNLFGCKIFISRECFIEDINIITMDSQLGWDFALSENFKLYSDISKKCEKVDSRNWYD